MQPGGARERDRRAVVVAGRRVVRGERALLRPRLAAGRPVEDVHLARAGEAAHGLRYAPASSTAPSAVHADTPKLSAACGSLGDSVCVSTQPGAAAGAPAHAYTYDGPAPAATASAAPSAVSSTALPYAAPPTGAGAVSVASSA